MKNPEDAKELNESCEYFEAGSREECHTKEYCFDVVDRQCHTKYVEKCRSVPKMECKDLPEVVECQVPHDDCRDEPEKSCQEVPREVCEDVVREACEEVPSETCRDVPRDECSTVTRQHCMEESETKKIKEEPQDEIELSGLPVFSTTPAPLSVLKAALMVVLDEKDCDADASAGSGLFRKVAGGNLSSHPQFPRTQQMVVLDEDEDEEPVEERPAVPDAKEFQSLQYYTHPAYRGLRQGNLWST